MGQQLLTKLQSASPTSAYGGFSVFYQENEGRELLRALSCEFPVARVGGLLPVRLASGRRSRKRKLLPSSARREVRTRWGSPGRAPGIGFWKENWNRKSVLSEPAWLGEQRPQPKGGGFRSGAYRVFDSFD